MWFHIRRIGGVLEFQRRFRWKYGQLERGWEFPPVSKKKLKSVNVNDHQPLFESKERLRSSEMKEDGLRFVLRVSEELYLNIYWILNIIWMYNIYIYIFLEQATPTSLEDQPLFESKRRLLAWKLKRSTPNKSKLTFRSQGKCDPNGRRPSGTR